MTKQMPHMWHTNIEELQQKNRFGTIRWKTIGEGLNQFYSRETSP